MQVVRAGLDDLGRITGLVVLDDVPAHAGGLRGWQDRRPVQHTLADGGEAAFVFALALGSVVLGMHREYMAAEFAQHRHRVQAGACHPGQVQLDLQVGPGYFKQPFQTGFAIDIDQLEVVVVVRQAHALVAQLFGDAAQFLSQGCPVRGVGGRFFSSG